MTVISDSGNTLDPKLPTRRRPPERIALLRAGDGFTWASWDLTDLTEERYEYVLVARQRKAAEG